MNPGVRSVSHVLVTLNAIILQSINTKPIGSITIEQAQGGILTHSCLQQPKRSAYLGKFFVMKGCFNSYAAAG